MNSADVAGALDGLRIVDFTSYLPGPYGTMLLADLGADVIHIEPMAGDPGRTGMPRAGEDSALHAWVGRNKRSLALDLKDPVDHKRCMDLVRACDIVFEGFTPGVASRLGIDYAACREINTSVIYCSISGYGYGNDFSANPGHDINFMAKAGFLDRVKGSGGEPAAVGPVVADVSAGLHATVGVLAALHHRTSTGAGQFIDVSLLGAAVAMTGSQLIKALAPDPVPVEEDFNLGRDPAYRAYQARDGQWLVLGALEDKFWRRLCSAVDRDDLTTRRESEPDAVAAELERLFLTRDRGDWDDLLESAGVCYSPVNAATEVAEDPQVKARVDIIDLGSSRQPANPIRMSSTPVSMRHPGPPLAWEGLSWR